jgi:hypothetical protein
MWDQVNLAYLQMGKPLIYGLATDDSHHYHRSGHEWSNAGRGWIMVQADSLAPEALIASMEKGNFYASTGVTLSKLSIDNRRLSVVVDQQPEVSYEIVFVGCKKGENEIRELSKVSGKEASIKLTSDLLFVRAKIISDKTHPNQVENINYEMAWTQPILIAD